jgi:lipopolysaccharide heptosyltransferase I
MTAKLTRRMDSDAPRSHAFTRILIIQLSALGDIVHAIPLLNQLRLRYPKAQIEWLTKPATAELLGDHPAIDAVIPFYDQAMRRPLRRGSAAASKLWQLVRRLRSGRYDLVIDLQGQSRSAACALLTGAPVRIGFGRPRAALNAASLRRRPVSAYRHAWAGAREGAWLAYTHPVALETIDLHAVDRFLRIGAMLGCPPRPADFSLRLSDAAEHRAEALLRERGIAEGDRFVLLAPSSAWETKQWGDEGFAALARHFLGHSVPAVLVGAGNDRELCAAVARKAPGVADLCGRTSLGELAALIRRAAAVVANDSGPLHLAVASGRPVAAVFGPTDPLWSGPYGHADAVAWSRPDCAPCYLRLLKRCPHGHVCMRAVEPADVISLTERALGHGVPLERPSRAVR